MILGISSSLVEEVNRLPGQLHKLPFETDISNLGNILLAITPVILKEERDGSSSVPMRAVKRQFENIRTGDRLRDLDCLSRV
jgi:hypothetical protein